MSNSAYSTLGSPTLSGVTATNITFSGTITNSTLLAGTVQGVTMTGTVTATGGEWIGMPAVKNGYTNLVITCSASTTLTITADEVYLQDDDNFQIKRYASMSETPAITGSGANGLDTGAEANSTWYHIWAIGKADGTLDSLLSASATAPTMPAGYNYKCYLGAVYNNSSGNFVAFSQTNSHVGIAAGRIVSAGTATSSTAASYAALAPPTAKLLYLLCYMSAAGYSITITSTSGGLFQMYSGYSATWAGHTVVCLAPSNIYYAVTGSSVYVDIAGWSY